MRYSLFEWCDVEELHKYTGDDSEDASTLIEIALQHNMGSYEVVNNNTDEVVATGPGNS